LRTFSATYIGLEYGDFIDTINYCHIVYMEFAVPFNPAPKVAVSAGLCHGPTTAVFQAGFRAVPRRFATIGKSSTESPL
jgi:hypothetical protein